VNDILTITPSVIIRRARSLERGIGVLDVPHKESGERALLIFASPEIAETFQADTGHYTAEEGFKVMPCDADMLRIVLGTLGFERVAVRGWESPDGIDFFDAADFIRMLRESLEG
jgi:hypothetical protein